MVRTTSHFRSTGGSRAGRRLRFGLADGRDRIAFHGRRVVPVSACERARENDLHELRDLGKVGGGRGRPEGGHPFVGHPAEHQGADVVQLADRVRSEVVVGRGLATASPMRNSNGTQSRCDRLPFPGRVVMRIVRWRWRIGIPAGRSRRPCRTAARAAGASASATSSGSTTSQAGYPPCCVAHSR